MPADLSDFEICVAQVRDELADTSIEFGVFRKSIPSLSLNRRVVWLPTTFTSGQPNRLNINGQGKDILLTDALVVEAYIVGTSYADAGEIRTRICNAVRNLYGAGATAADGSFPHEVPNRKTNADELLELEGDVVVQRFVWQMDMRRLDKTFIAKVDAIEMVDSTQITTTVDGALTPSESSSIE